MAFPRAASVSDAALQYARSLTCWFRDYITAIKHGRLHPFTPLERKVREATRNEPWGPTGCQLNELTEASLDPNSCSVIYAVLVFRLQYPPEKWRNVYKVLEFILKRGGEGGVEEARTEFLTHLEELTDFAYIGPEGRDYGVNVRVRAAAVMKLLQDDVALQEERQKLKRVSRQLRGYTRAEMQQQAPPDDLTRRNSWGGGELVRSDPSEHEPPRLNGALNRGAGEMKGVSLQDNKKYLAELKKILARPENKICADCHEQMPTWASINCGVFICLRCSGIHRGLGVHISKVRSCTLDTWLPSQVQFLAQTGNQVANAYWEAQLESPQRPVGERALADFIREKYSQRRYASGVWPPETNRQETVPGPSEPKTVHTMDSFPSGVTLQVGPKKVPEHYTPNDLLRFEDEAFGYESGELVQPIAMDSTEMAEVVAEEAAEQPGHKKTLSFENSALFEQRSSFLKMRSRRISAQGQNPPVQDALPPMHPSRTPRSERPSSGEVIKTTLLDFDDLESISETMSLASSRMLVPGFIAKPAVNGSSSTAGRPPVVEAPNRTQMVRAENRMPAAAVQPPRRPKTVSVPILDLLDAPLEVLPATGTDALATSPDPFSFMTSLEPLTILKESPRPAEPVPKEEPPVPVAIQEPVAPAASSDGFIITPVRSRRSLANRSRGGLSMSQQAAQPPPKKDSTVLSDAEVKSIHDMSRLDQLFVQQIEDFLHFGYRSSMYQKPSYL